VPPDVARSVAVGRRAGRVGFRYSVPSLHFERSTELTELEAACVLYLAQRADITGLAPSPAELDALHIALSRLSGGLAARLLR